MSKETEFDSLLNEVIESLLEYDSQEKIEQLKIKLRYLQEVDDENKIYVADYGDSLSAILNTASPSTKSYVFCLPGVITDGAVSTFDSNFRIVPVSKALADADFHGITLNNKCYFVSAYLSGCDFSGADFTGTDFTGADVSNSNFSGAVLTNAKIHNVNFKRAILTGATMPENANTIPEFKEVVGADNWDDAIVWTDNILISEYRVEEVHPDEEPHK